MALTEDIVTVEAQAIKSVCDEAAAMLQRIHSALEHNADLAIEWTADPKPDYIAEDPDGNLSSLNFSRAEVSNAIYSLSLIRSLLTNQDMDGTQGDHLGNINKLASPNQWRVRVGN